MNLRNGNLTVVAGSSAAPWLPGLCGGLLRPPAFSSSAWRRVGFVPAHPVGDLGCLWECVRVPVGTDFYQLWSTTPSGGSEGGIGELCPSDRQSQSCSIAIFSVDNHSGLENRCGCRCVPGTVCPALFMLTDSSRPGRKT